MKSEMKLDRKYALYFYFNGIIGIFSIIIGIILLYFVIDEILYYEINKKLTSYLNILFCYYIIGFGIYNTNILIKIRKTNIYIPGEGFRFYRLNKANKIERMKRIWIISIPAVLIITALTLLDRHFILTIGFLVCFALLFLVIGLVKKRITFHEEIDDATLYELQRLNIIKSTEVVKSLYKDFLSWNSVKTDNKLLVLTMDSLIILSFHDRINAKKVVFPLSKLYQLRILNYGMGFLINLSTKEECHQIVLKGGSYQDSPEEFIRSLLSQTDDCLQHANERSAENIELRTSNIRILDLV